MIFLSPKKVVSLFVFAAIATLFALSAATAEKGAQANTLAFCVGGAPCDYDLIDGTSFGAAAASRTITKTLDSSVGAGWTRIAQVVKAVVDDAGALTVTVTCTRSIDGVSYGSVPSLSVSSGAATVSPLVYSFAAAGSATTIQTIDLDVFGYRYVKCVYAATGTTDTGDLMYVQWTAASSK